MRTPQPVFAIGVGIASVRYLTLHIAQNWDCLCPLSWYLHPPSLPL